MQNWTRQSLQETVRERLQGFRFIAVSNREPYIHSREGRDVKCITPASGLTSAIDPILRAAGGTWVAHASGDADRFVTDANDCVMVPPGKPAYRLRRVWLTKQLEKEYYYGLSNEGLWPLCHAAYHRPRFTQRNWESYREANRLFADAVLEEANGDPAFVFVQDYHLGLLPRMIKESNPNLAIAHFWHIPWPNRETFRVFPWKQELLDGLLGNDVMGFHLRYHCSNFLETVDRNIEALIDSEHGKVTRLGHSTLVRPFPISIDFAQHTRAAMDSGVAAASAEWLNEMPCAPEVLGIGIDRIDYTKGIPERLCAVDHFLDAHPEYVGRFTFLQVGVPSRTAIADYEDLDRELAGQVDSLNAKWARRNWKPIVFVRRHVDQTSLIALHLMADFCIVSSLHDGMNLVAKEFVASRFDGDGVLILSEFTGSARELTDALIVNPYAPEEISGAIDRALTMPATERRRRMNRMRAAVSANNIFRWAGKIVMSLSGVEMEPPAADCASEAGDAYLARTA